jgi:uncharacterized membrane protein (DUF485 family)
MEYYRKLPRNKKEFAIFMAVISIISVNIIAPLITCFETEFSLCVWADAMKRIPFVWIGVIALVLVTHKPAEWMTLRIVKKEDSFNALMIVNTLCAVLLMSALLTVVGTWIGNGQVTMEPMNMFFYKWPRNFSISFAVEALIAQPVARRVMLGVHKRKDKRSLPATQNVNK